MINYAYIVKRKRDKKMARNKEDKNKDNKNKDNKNNKLLKYMSYGICLGLLLGVCFGVITSYNLAICCSLGMCIGVFSGAIGSMFK